MYECLVENRLGSMRQNAMVRVEGKCCNNVVSSVAILCVTVWLIERQLEILAILCNEFDVPKFNLDAKLVSS